jgi:hypothetical protein
MTTLYVILCAIRDWLAIRDEPPPGAIRSQLSDTSTDAEGRDQFRYGLDLQYEDSGEVLEQIANGNTEHALRGKANTRSVNNILNAYDVALIFLNQEFGDDPDKIRTFYGYLTNKVKLIRIETSDVAKALKIFETINDRGVGLDSMDLLKNLLFMKADRSKFDKLKTIWKSLQDTIHAAGEKPLRFLRYFIFSRYDVDVLREDEIYGWFARNEERCGYSENPVRFASELVDAARAYSNFLSGKDQSGSQSPFLESTRLLAGGSARQHLILLLAGRHLSPELFDKLCKEVENLFFCYIITRENTRDFERNFAAWAAELRSINSEDQLSAFIEKRFEKTRSGLAVRFGEAMNRLSTEALQSYRLRYVLAKLTQYYEIAAYGETEGTKWLRRFTGPGFEIEHIFPEAPCAEAIEEFGDRESEDEEQRLGNLVLVEKSINASLGNKPFSKKKSVYPKSQLLLARAISEKIQVGVNTKIDRAVRGLEPFETWNSAAIRKRQEALTDLAFKVWEVPEAVRRD